jgi:transcriptional regulator with XRE-family HTH domain
VNENNAFGTVLRNLRTKAGLSQEGLALECGLDRSFISLLERGLRQPTLKTILQLIDTMEVPLTDFAKQLDKMRHEN